MNRGKYQTTMNSLSKNGLIDGEWGILELEISTWILLQWAYFCNYVQWEELQHSIRINRYFYYLLRKFCFTDFEATK